MLADRIHEHAHPPPDTCCEPARADLLLRLHEARCQRSSLTSSGTGSGKALAAAPSTGE